ncbi:MAG TPA: hypothetical protein EYP04_11970 [Anaerolineae bacterium]|nr:hypothetical protein [Anaerolineae bacterium]
MRVLVEVTIRVARVWCDTPAELSLVTQQEFHNHIPLFQGVPLDTVKIDSVGWVTFEHFFNELKGACVLNAQWFAWRFHRHLLNLFIALDPVFK